MTKGYLARRIYLSPSEWLRNALLSVDTDKGWVSVSSFEGVEPPATTFVEGIILPFEPRFVGSVSLQDYLSAEFPPSEGVEPLHYWSLEYPGLFSGHETPADAASWHVAQLC